MRYFNREAVEIDEDEWFSLTLDPKYTMVARNSYGVTDVLTQWLGIQTIYCPRPVIWCTFSRKWDDGTISYRSSFWFTDQIEIHQVLAFHKSLVMEVGIPIGVPARSRRS